MQLKYNRQALESILFIVSGQQLHRYVMKWNSLGSHRLQNPERSEYPDKKHGAYLDNDIPTEPFTSISSE
jgi:hypothetical protein